MKTQTLGQNIQAARRAQNLSQETLAEKIGVSRQALGKWENDTALPGLDNLQALAQTLEISVDALLGLPPQPSQTEPAAPQDLPPQKATPTQTPPAVTLPAVQALLQAQYDRTRRWMGLPLVLVFALAAGLMVLGGIIKGQNDRLAVLENQAAGLSSQMAGLQAQLGSLQMPQSSASGAVSAWDCVPTGQANADGSFPAHITVSPRQWQEGTQATFLLESEQGIQDVALTLDPATGRFTADATLQVGVGYYASILLKDTADVATNDGLGYVRVQPEDLQVEFYWVAGGTRIENTFRYADGLVELKDLTQNVEVFVPGWTTLQTVTVQLWIDGEPADEILLEREAGTEDFYVFVGTGNFDGSKTYPCQDPESVYCLATATTADGATHLSARQPLTQYRG